MAPSQNNDPKLDHLSGCDVRFCRAGDNSIKYYKRKAIITKSHGKHPLGSPGAKIIKDV